jgi:hypothetical protein
MTKRNKMLRAPDWIWAGFAQQPEVEKGRRRQAAIDWLMTQTPRRDTIYVMPDPETGEELHLGHPGVQ